MISFRSKYLGPLAPMAAVGS